MNSLVIQSRQDFRSFCQKFYSGVKWRMPMITISLCMIVKNEEKNLERCLKSYAPLMDEIIVVDTGSTDRTKEIASRFTDKIYDFEWICDFSAARNFSFEKATCDYIFSADADEVLDDQNRAQFEILKQVLDEEIEIVQMYYGNQFQNGTIYNYDCELRPKLFKRLRTFKWIEPIHETVRTLPVVFDSDIVITHLPENSHTKRDLAAFERMVTEGISISTRLHNIYAKELFVSGDKEDFEKAIGFFEESFSDETRAEDEKLEAICVLSKAYRMLGKDAKFIKYALLSEIGLCSELCYEIGQYFYENEEHKDALHWFSMASEYTKPILNIHYGDKYPKEGIEKCMVKLGENAQ